MSQGVFATPNIGSTGAEVAQVQPEAANYSGIPSTFENVTRATPEILQGAYHTAGVVESGELKDQAQQLSTQFQEGFKQDLAVQSSAKTLGQMRQAVSQGQMSTSSLLIRAKAIQDKAKGISPQYGPEIDEVFAKNGIDPNGRNGLPSSTSNYEDEALKDKMKTVTAWHRDPNMSQYVVYQPGMDQTEDNIDVQSTIDNVSKVNNTLRSTEQGLSSVVSDTLGTIDSQMSNQLSKLQQAKGDPASIAAQQQAVVSQFKNQINQLVAFSTQNLGKFPPGSDQYKNIQAQIASVRAFKNDLETMTPEQLLSAKTNADMVAANLSSVTGQYKISYIESGLQGLEDLSRINANGTIVFDDSTVKLIQNKLLNGQPLDPTEQSLYNFSKSPASYVNFLNSNSLKQSYNQMDNAAPKLLAQTDSQSLTSFIGGSYNNYQDDTLRDDTKKKLASNAARLLDGSANTGMFIKSPDNYLNIVKQTANPNISELLNTLPKDQRDLTANNIAKTSLTALTASGLPFSLPQLRANGTKIFIDNRTNTIGFGGADSPNPVSGLPNEYQPWQTATSAWNDALQSMVNVSSYDPNLRGKSKSDIILELLKQNGYPEDLIQVTN